MRKKKRRMRKNRRSLMVTMQKKPKEMQREMLKLGLLFL